MGKAFLPFSVASQAASDDQIEKALAWYPGPADNRRPDNTCPSSRHPGWGWCLVSDSARSQLPGETLYGDLYCLPPNLTRGRWHPLGPADAGSGSLCPILAPSGKQSVCHHILRFHTVLCERQSELSLGSVNHPLPCSPIFLLSGTFCLFVFISVLISFNTLHSLSPNSQ